MFILEGPTSFVTFTHCCQEPKNTFINGKTGMAPQRNILTSPEEPAGRFRAHPQEAGAPYLLGSPPGEGSTLLRPAFPRRALRLGFLGWIVLRWLLQPGQVHPRQRCSSPGLSGPGSSRVTAPSRHSPLWPVPSDCTWRVEAASRQLSGLPGTERCLLGERGSWRPTGSVRGVFLPLHSQSLRLPSVCQVLTPHNSSPAG